MDSNVTSQQSSTLVPTRADLQLSNYSSSTSDPNKTNSDVFAPQYNGAILSNSALYSTTGSGSLSVSTIGDTTQKITVPSRPVILPAAVAKKSVNWPLFGASLLLVAVAVYILLRTGDKQHKKELLKR